MRGERYWKRLDWIRRSLSFDGGSQSGTYQPMIHFHWLNHLQGAGLLEKNMKDIYFTITGCNHYFGQEFMKKGMKVTLVKEPDNKFDKEAIRVEMKG